MISSYPRTAEARARDIRVTEKALTVDLADGRTVSAPLSWYPRLLHGSTEERSNRRPISRGEGIHWPDLDEDVRVQDLLDGHGSGEARESLDRWLDSRRDPNTEP